MSTLIPKTVKVKVCPDKLTDSQREIIRCLTNGRHIYIDSRGKYRMSVDENNPDDSVASGHGKEHLYRPTIIFFIEEGIVTRSATLLPTHFPHLFLNRNYDGKFKEEINEVMVEAALGVRRNTDDKKRI